MRITHILLLFVLAGLVVGCDDVTPPAATSTPSLPTAEPTATVAPVPTLEATPDAYEHAIPETARVRTFAVINDVLHAGTDAGVYQLDLKTNTWHRIPGTRDIGLVNALELDTNGDLLVGADAENKSNADHSYRGGLFRIMPNGEIRHEIVETVFDLAVHTNHSGELHVYAGTWDRGLLVHNETGWETAPEVAKYPGLTRIHSIGFVNSGLVLGTVHTGAYFIGVDGTFMEISTKTSHGLASDEIRVLTHTSTGRPSEIWVGEMSGKLELLDFDLPIPLSKSFEVPGDGSISGITADRNGVLWIAFLNDGTRTLNLETREWKMVDQRPAFAVQEWAGMMFIGTDGHGLVTAPLGQ